MANVTGKVWIVGAGPGSLDYLTLQAYHCLQQAEVLIYDALSDPRLLALVPTDCETIAVGKRGGQPSIAQAEINQCLVAHCQRGKTVVRLKGGDPFIFGRCREEMQALREAGCPFAVIPGLSSALVAPLLAGIPLTDAVLSQSFAVATAHDLSRLNWSALAAIETLVLLMGGRHLAAIVQTLQHQGRSPQTPIAVIRWAGRPEQQIWVGTLADITDQTQGQSLSPVVMVIGEVVRWHEYFAPELIAPELIVPKSIAPESIAPESIAPESIAPESIAPESIAPESIAPESIAPEPVAPEPVASESIAPESIAPEPVASESIASESIAPNAIDPMSNPVARWDKPMPTIFRPAISRPAISRPVISRAAMQAPVSQSSLPLSHTTVLVTRSANQSREFTDLLQAAGATVLEMPTLVIKPPSSWANLDAAIARLETFDWLILTSANGVDAFFERLAVAARAASSLAHRDARALAGIKLAVVGKKTARALQQYGLRPDFVPPEFVADALVSHFPETVAGQQMLFPRVESGGRDVLVKELTQAGAIVTEVAAYESGCPDHVDPDILAALNSGKVDVITFASSKTVKHFTQLVGLEGTAALTTPVSWLTQVAIASIGPQTSQTCKHLLGRVDIEAREYTLEGLVQAIVEWRQS